jgi:hypothetical protein
MDLFREGYRFCVSLSRVVSEAQTSTAGEYAGIFPHRSTFPQASGPAYGIQHDLRLTHDEVALERPSFLIGPAAIIAGTNSSMMMHP